MQYKESTKFVKGKLKMQALSDRADKNSFIPQSPEPAAFIGVKGSPKNAAKANEKHPKTNPLAPKIFLLYT